MIKGSHLTNQSMQEVKKAYETVLKIQETYCKEAGFLKHRKEAESIRNETKKAIKEIENELTRRKQINN